MTLLNFLKQSSLFHVYYFAIFFISGLIVNLIQVFTLPLWLFSKSLYRLANGYLVYLHWAQMVFLLTTYSGSQLYLHCDERFFTAMTQDHALMLVNHKFGLDWLAMWCVAEVYGQLFSAKCFVKNELKYVPLLGWSFYLLEFPFLRRNFTKDRGQIVEGVEMLAEFPMPAKLCLFCEGTRYTPEKYEKSRRYALEQGLPVLKHHLTPRTKGFCMAIEGLKGRVPAILDITIAAESVGDSATCTLYDLLRGKQAIYHGYIKVRDMDEVPSGSEKEMSEYCHSLYQQKDEALEYFYKHDTFYGFDDTVKQHFMSPRIQPALVMLFWHVLLGSPIVYHLCRLLVTGSLLTISVFILVVLLVQMALIRMTSLADASHGSEYGSSNGQGSGKKSNLCRNLNDSTTNSSASGGPSCHINHQTNMGNRKDQ